jgi:hypothetical protein
MAHGGDEREDLQIERVRIEWAGRGRGPCPAHAVGGVEVHQFGVALRGALRQRPQEIRAALGLVFGGIRR